MQSWRAPWTIQPWQTSLNAIASASISPNGRISPPPLRNFSTTPPAVAVANLKRYARPCGEDAHSCSAPASLVGRVPPASLSPPNAPHPVDDDPPRPSRPTILNSKWPRRSELDHYLWSILTSCKGYASPSVHARRGEQGGHPFAATAVYRYGRTSPIDS
jgi:hypothetical protein